MYISMTCLETSVLLSNIFDLPGQFQAGGGGLHSWLPFFLKDINTSLKDLSYFIVVQ